MKYFFALLVVLIAVRDSFAQTNTFPSDSGNAGIGTISPPIADLQIGYFSKGGPSTILIPGTYNFEQLNLGQLSKIQAQSSPVNYIPTVFPNTPALFELTNLSQSNITSKCCSTFAKR
jgi:hypothetical protein